MQGQFTIPITYFLEEGRSNLEECLRISFQAALHHKIAKLVIFTARGDGIKLAIANFLSRPEYEQIEIIGVTFPGGKEFTDNEGKQFEVKISDEDMGLFRQKNIPIIRAHLPFDPLMSRRKGRMGIHDSSAVNDVLNIFCGSMTLCVQAVLMVCDAGVVAAGEHVISLTSDTSILARATSTRRALKELLVREILCKPAIMNISRNELPGSLAERKPKEISTEASTPQAPTEGRKQTPKSE